MYKKSLNSYIAFSSSAIVFEYFVQVRATSTSLGSGTGDLHLSGIHRIQTAKKAEEKKVERSGQIGLVNGGPGLLNNFVNLKNES